MHRFTVDFRGDSGAALKTAQQLMAERGFAVSKIGGGEVRGTRSHPFFGNKTNDMIALVSELVIRASASQLSADAELGTLQKLIVFIVVLMVGMESVFLFVGFVVLQNTLMVWISLMTVAPWFIIAPAMLYAFRRAALREVQTLLNNTATMAESE